MIARSIAPRLTTAFQQFPAVVLTGARQTGKTTLVRSLWPGASYVSLDQMEKAAQTVENPDAFLRSLVEPAIAGAFIACRTETPYPLPGGEVTAVPVGGDEGLLARLAGAGR